MPGRVADKSARVNWFATLSHRENRAQIKRLIYHPQNLPGKHLDFVLLDTSSSTLSNNALTTTLGIVKGLCSSAYTKRNHFAVTHFGNNNVLSLINPRRAPKHIEKDLVKIKAGGGTPLRKGLLTACKTLSKLQKEYSSQTLYVFTDGRSRESVDDVTLPCKTVIIDTEKNTIALGKCKQLAARLHAEYIHMNDITHGHI